MGKKARPSGQDSPTLGRDFDLRMDLSILLILHLVFSGIIENLLKYGMCEIPNTFVKYFFVKLIIQTVN